MQAFCCEVARALTKLGMAMAAKQADDGYDDHDFNEGEAGFMRLIDCHTRHFRLYLVGE